MRAGQRMGRGRAGGTKHRPVAEENLGGFAAAQVYAPAKQKSACAAAAAARVESRRPRRLALPDHCQSSKVTPSMLIFA